MNDSIRRAIRQKARGAHNKDQLVEAVFASFRGAEVDLRKVSLEDMKIAVVEAARSARATCSNTRVAL